MSNKYGINIDTEDITCRPKRTQADNLKAVFGDTETAEETVQSSVPRILTVERAIRYYEEHATGEFKELYNFTARCLREFNDRSLNIKGVSDDE